MRRFVPVAFFLGVACARAEGARDDGASGPALGLPAGTVGGRVAEASEKAEVTPELARRAREILERHADAPIGTEVPFVLDGRRYVARIEIHDNPDGSPERPSGEHKGVTVYVAP